MNNSPNKNNNNKNDKLKRRIMTFLPYILIPLIMVGAITFAGKTAKAKSEKTEYYQIVQYFDEGKIDKFSLNLSSGALKYKLVGEDEKEKEKKKENHLGMVLIQQKIWRIHGKLKFTKKHLLKNSSVHIATRKATNKT